LAPSCNSQRHGQTFSSPCAYARAFRLPHALHIRQQFNEFLVISNSLLSLEFGILLHLRLILLAFLILILLVVGLTERALLVLVIFLDLLLFVGQLAKSFVAQSTTQAEYVAAASCLSKILWIVQTM
jgi:hypothetical protein